MMEFFKTTAALAVLILILASFTSCTDSKKKTDESGQDTTSSTNAIQTDDYALGAGVMSVSVDGDIIVPDTEEQSKEFTHAFLNDAWRKVTYDDKERGEVGAYSEDFYGLVYHLSDRERLDLSDSYRFMFLADSAFVDRFEPNTFSRLAFEEDETYSPAFSAILEEANAEIEELYNRPIKALDLFALADKGDLVGFYGSFEPEGKQALGFIAIKLEEVFYIFEDPKEIGEYGTWRVDDDNMYPAPILHGYMTDKEGHTVFLLSRPISEGVQMNYYVPMNGKLSPLKAQGWTVHPM
ncbi:hypothetical protein [Porphyromonas cangingivalis]|uniref:hypothetical protein n=1 Tax=Porphyromonas cangingivalis TaxID=36874 RepID=UPI000DD4B053|nr:hypothetical protein [Porphyromonas cangingivalis]